MTVDPFAIVDKSASDADKASDAQPAVRALVKPALHYQKPFEAELLGRVGNGKVQVRLEQDGRKAIFAVERFRLFHATKEAGRPRERLPDACIDALPWKGAGIDPLTAPRATAAPHWSPPGRVLP